jgi:hypothetical protein
MAGSNVWVKCGKVYNLDPNGTGLTTTGAAPRIYKDSPFATFQATGTTTASTGAATIKIQGSNVDDVNSYVDLGTITLTLGTTLTADGFATTAPWRFVRANVTAISGTGASVNVYMGV